MSIDTSLTNDDLRTLVAFSAAQSFAISTNNPLDIVLPLFQPIATALHGQMFREAALANELSKRYDLIVSDELCIYWSRILRERRLLVPATDTIDSGSYVWSQQNMINSTDGQFASDLEEILKEARFFIVKSDDLLLQSYTDEQLVLVLRRGAIGSLFPKLYKQDGKLGNEDQYIFSRFFQYAANQKIHVAESLSKLRRAAIYCDLILHLQAPRTKPNNSQIIFAYLDSPIVMDIIGLGGKKRQSLARRLTASFKSILFSPYVNKDIIDEIRNNVRALLKNHPKDRFGPTADALRSGELNENTIVAILDRLERVIQDEELNIDRVFELNLSDQNRMDDHHRQNLLSKLQSHYTNFSAAERDVRTIRGVFGKRGKTIPNDLYSAKSIFITGNEMLAAIGNRFFRENLKYSESNFPVVVTRSTAAALSDAIVGISTSGSMSFTDMLISAADATQYDNRVFEEIERKLREIAPNEADDLVRLLSRMDYSQLAMDIVKGSSQNVNAHTVHEIATIIKTKLELEAEQRAKEKISKISRDYQKVSIQNQEISKEQKSKIDAAIGQIEEMHKSAKSNILVLHEQSERKVRNWTVCSFFVLGIFVPSLVFAFTYLVAYFPDYLSTHPRTRFLVSIFTALLAATPLIGIPSLRNFIKNKVIESQNKILVSKIIDFNYRIQDPMAKSPQCVGEELDQQHKERLAIIEFVDRESTAVTKFF